MPQKQSIAELNAALAQKSKGGKPAVLGGAPAVLGGGKKRKQKRKPGKKPRKSPGKKPDKAPAPPSSYQKYVSLIDKQNALIQKGSGAKKATKKTKKPISKEYKPQYAVEGGGNVDHLVIEEAAERAPSEKLPKMTLDGALNKVLESMGKTTEPKELKGGKPAVLGGSRRKTRPAATKPTSPGRSKMQRRAVLVKKVMQEKRLTLPQASKYIKEQKMEY